MSLSGLSLFTHNLGLRESMIVNIESITIEFLQVLTILEVFHPHPSILLPQFPDLV
jgi:hypothetical protein